MLKRLRRTKHGRSDGPACGVHSTARTSAPATDVKVPHSWTTTRTGSLVRAAPTDIVCRVARAATTTISALRRIIASSRDDESFRRLSQDAAGATDVKIGRATG